MQSIADITDSLTLQQIQTKAWAVQRTQTYPKVLGFKPYDLAICALLDSYYPRKINFYILNLEDHQKNLKLAIDVMKELGIEVLISNEKDIDDNTLLKQLEAAQKVLEPNGIKDNNAEAPKVIGNIDNTQEKFEEEIKKDKNDYFKQKKAEAVVPNQEKKNY